MFAYVHVCVRGGPRAAVMRSRHHWVVELFFPITSFVVVGTNCSPKVLEQEEGGGGAGRDVICNSTQPAFYAGCVERVILGQKVFSVECVLDRICSVERSLDIGTGN
jgi:hypothetical protein